MAEKITIQGLEISLKKINEEDYISLTDMASKRVGQRAGDVIRSWLRNSGTLLFLETWEELHNPNFKNGEMTVFKSDAHDHRVDINTKRFVETTGAIGLLSKKGRYGGTYGHIDIALEFASWLDPSFKVFFIKDYQRLKTEEAKRLNSNWTFSRFLSKVNYQIHTEAIKENIIPRIEKSEQYVFANEADMLNLVVFGMTAKEWREAYPEQARSGNIRDFATQEQLVVLANMEAINAMLVDVGASQDARYDRLHGEAARQIKVLKNKGLLPGKG